MTEQQAQAAGHAVRTSVIGMDFVARAQVAHDLCGLVKLVDDAHVGLLCQQAPRDRDRLRGVRGRLGRVEPVRSRAAARAGIANTRIRRHRTQSAIGRSRGPDGAESHRRGGGHLGVVAVPIALGAQLVAAAVPWVGFTLGVAMAMLAVLVLAGRRIALPGSVFRARGQHNQGGVFLVGAGYGVSSLGCGLPLFLAAVGAAVAAGGRFAAVEVMAAYAAGMAVALIMLAIGMAAVRGTVIRLVGRTQARMRWINRALLQLGRRLPQLLLGHRAVHTGTTT